MLRSRRLTGLAGTSALGSAIAGTLWIFFLLCFDRTLDASLYDDLAFLQQPLSPPQLANLSYQLGRGLLVGATLWLIARPDRAASG